MRCQLGISHRQRLADLHSRQPFRPSKVIETGLLLRDQLPDRPRNDPGRHRVAKLVGKQREAMSASDAAPHVFHKTPVTGRGSPRRQGQANDRMAGVGENHLFRRRFGLPVIIDRIDAVRFDIPALPAVEHLIA